MATIPTARKLQRVAPAGARGGGVLGFVPAPRDAVPGAIQQAGADFQQAGKELSRAAEREEQERKQQTRFNNQADYLEFQNQKQQELTTSLDEADPGEVGLAVRLTDQYNRDVQQFIQERIPPEQRKEFEIKALGSSGEIFKSVKRIETKRKSDYYNDRINGTFETMFKNNAPPAAIKQEVGKLIEEADMSKTWKQDFEQSIQSKITYATELQRVQSDPAYASKYLPGRGGNMGTVVEKIIQIESGGKATAKAKTSTATGLGQFIESTWLDMIKRYRPDVAKGKTRAQILALRVDPALSREMVGNLTQENSTRLRAAGIQATPGNIYLAHFLGPGKKGGAVGVLSVPDETPISDVLAANRIKANPGVFRNVKTAGDLKRWASKKMSGAKGASGPQTVSENQGGVGSIPEDLTIDQFLKLQNQARATNEQFVTDQVNELKFGVLDGVAGREEIELAREELNLDPGQYMGLMRILEDKVKNDADDAAITSFGQAIAAGNAQIDYYNTDQKKFADKAYESIVGSALPEQQAQKEADYIAATQYIPKTARSALLRAYQSNDPEQVAQALERSSVFKVAAPGYFSVMENGGKLRKDNDLYESMLRLGYTKEEIANRVIRNRTPEGQAATQRLVESKEGKKWLSDQATENNVGDLFDPGILHSQPEVGNTPEQQGRILGEYRTVLEQSYLDSGGDQDAALEIAKERFTKLYGASKTNISGDKVLMRLPPEKAYAPIIQSMQEVTYEDIQQQFIDDMARAGITEGVAFLESTDQTDLDFRQGLPARYKVYFFDKLGQLQQYNQSWAANVDKLKEVNRERIDKIKLEAVDRQFVKKEEAQIFHDATAAGQKAYDETPGPEWIKQRAAMEAQERVRLGLDDQERTQSKANRQQQRVADDFKQEMKVRDEAIRQRQKGTGNILRGYALEDQFGGTSPAQQDEQQ